MPSCRLAVPADPVLIGTSTVSHYQLTANGKKLEAKIVSMKATVGYREWRHSSTDYPWLYMDLCGQLRVPAALLLGKETPVRTE